MKIAEAPQATVAQPQVQEEYRREEPVTPCGLVIFGASGDLARRKLFPSLYHLFQGGFLPKGFYVVGVARTPMDDGEFRKRVLEGLNEFAQFGPLQKDGWGRFCSLFYYLSGDYDDPETYRHLDALTRKLDRENGVDGSRLFYLATPPAVYPAVAAQLGAAGLGRRGSESVRVVIEKPFGRDLESARALSGELEKFFSEDQIYRIDHYLGKETAQNVLILRFANAVFEPIWNRNYVDHVQITAAESDGVEHRAGYYDQSGALRDMVQNHILQLLCLVAMEPPSGFEAEAVRDERTKVMRCLRPIPEREARKFALRGQYGGSEADGRVPGYRQEPGVEPDSKTETFAALKVFVDNWRWQDVPFYVRTGKRLPARASAISIHFKRVPAPLFRGFPLDTLAPNVLTLRIQPDEGVSLQFETKQPGPKLSMSRASLDFSFQDSFGSLPTGAYERLLLDCMAGDPTLFARRDWVELSWAYLQPVLNAWKAEPALSFPNYKPGSWGPEEAMKFVTADGRAWRDP